MDFLHHHLSQPSSLFSFYDSTSLWDSNFQILALMGLKIDWSSEILSRSNPLISYSVWPVRSHSSFCQGMHNSLRREKTGLSNSTHWAGAFPFVMANKPSLLKQQQLIIWEGGRIWAKEHMSWVAVLNRWCQMTLARSVVWRENQREGWDQGQELLLHL